MDSNKNKKAAIQCLTILLEEVKNADQVSDCKFNVVGETFDYKDSQRPTGWIDVDFNIRFLTINKQYMEEKDETVTAENREP